MSESDPHVFRNRFLRFSVRKPESWDFMPPAWSPVEQLKNSGNEEWEWVRNANKPFCCMRKLHDSPVHAYPTMQVTARRFDVPTDEQAAAFLKSQCEFLSKQYSNLEVLEATSSAFIGGARANSIRGRFKLIMATDSGPVTLPILSRVHTVFTSGTAFTMGLSSSADPNYYDESDFDRIIASVRIGIAANL
jgi:hypothetical protein